MMRPALLTAVFTSLAILFGWETHQAWRELPGAEDAAASAPRDLRQPGVAAPDPAPPADTAATVSAIASRPLFRPDRQPYRESAASAAPLRNHEAELSRFTLLGILAIGGEQRGLVVSRVGNRTDRWELKEGDSLPGFTVKEVRTDGLLVTADGREFQLPLYAGPPAIQGGVSPRTEVQRQPPSPSSPVPAVQPPAPAAVPAIRGTIPGIPAAVPPADPDPTSITRTQSRPPRYMPGRRP